jgi:hypothetical protein
MSTNFGHRDPGARAQRFGKNAPDQGSVFVVPELNTISVGYMLAQDEFIADKLIPSVTVDVQEGKYAEYPRGYFFRDEMKPRADGAESAGSGFEINFNSSYKANVYAYHVDAGPQMRANAKSIDIDNTCTMLATRKAKIKREKFFYDNFFKTGVWATQVQGKTSGGGGVAGTDLSWADANAKPLSQMKKAIRDALELTGFRVTKATFSGRAWDVFSEHRNVVNRINAGQTPGGPAEISTEQLARWLKLDAVYVSEALVAGNNEGSASEDTLSFMDTAEDAVLLTFTPKTPSKLTPSAFYFFDWQADNLVSAYGTAVSRWWNQDRKSMRFEIEMATDPKKVAADCGIWMYDFLAT